MPNSADIGSLGRATVKSLERWGRQAGEHPARRGRMVHSRPAGLSEIALAHRD
jgi:hypothetical protein